jgi:hypothetical protein
LTFHWGDAAFAQSYPLQVREQDGIIAVLAVRPTEAAVRWRFLQTPPSPLTEIVAAIGGRPLNITLEQYPEANARTSILLLLDVTKSRKNDDIDRQRLTLIEIARHAKEHDKIAIAAYADGIHPLRPPDANIGTLTNMLATVQPEAAPAKMGQVLANSMDVLSRIPARRIAIYALSDGHSDDTLNVPGLTARARQFGINLYFILSSSDRSMDLSALTQIAKSTGGMVVTENQLGAFLKDPFFLVDSGATAHLSLEGARRFFWERESKIDVVLRYGDRSLELSAPADVPMAGVGETGKYLIASHPIGVFGSAGVTAAGALGLAVLMMRRRTARKQQATVAQDEESARVFAVIQNIDDGSAYPICAQRISLGRAADNDVVIDDSTISRNHAVLTRDDDGTFFIESSGKNGTFVNHSEIEHAPLSDGDLITLGHTTFRFLQKQVKS